MPSVQRVALSCVLALGLLGGSTAYAQDSPWGDVSVSFVSVDYDLSGVGNAPGLAIRATRNLTSGLRLEFGGLYSKPNQQFGPSTLFAPEAQLQYRWALGRWSPYVGGGAGTALVRGDIVSDWDPTLSFAAGTGLRLNDSIGVKGELRLRGHEFDFVGTSTELSIGLVWEIASF